MYKRFFSSYPYPVFLLSLAMLLLGLPLSRALMSVGMGVLVVAALLEGPFQDKWRRLRKRPFAFLLAGLSILFSLSLLYSDNQEEWSSWALMYLPFLVIPLAVAVFPPLPVLWRKRLVHLFILGCLLATLICLLMGIEASYAAGTPWAFRYFYYTRLSAYLALHPAYFTLFLGLAIWGHFWWTGERLRASLSVNWYVSAFLTIWLLGFMVLLSSRMQLISFLLVSGIAGFVYVYRLKMLLRGILISAAILTLGASFVSFSPAARERMGGLLDRDAFGQDVNQNVNAITIRRAVWDAGWGVYLKDPWMGTGLADVRDDLLHVYQEEDYVYGERHELGPHSAYLATIMALGPLGLAYLIGLFIMGGVLSWQKKNPLYLAVLIFFALCSLTESMLSRQWGIVFFALMTTLMLFGGIGQLAKKGSGPVLLPVRKVSPER